MLLLAPWSAERHPADLVGAAFGVASALCYATNVLVSKRLVPVFSGSEMALYHGFVALPLLVLLVPIGAWAAVAAGRAGVARGAASLVPGAVCGLLWVWGLRSVRASHASNLTLLEPLVATLGASVALRRAARCAARSPAAGSSSTGAGLADDLGCAHAAGRLGNVAAPCREAAPNILTGLREPPDRSGETSPSRPPLPERIVLVVDDEATTRTLVCRWLKSAGFVCREAASGEEALARIQEEPEAYEAMVLDVMMPGMDGFEVLASGEEEPRAERDPRSSS